MATGDGVVIKKEIGDGLDVVPNGINVAIDAEDTKDLTPNYYYHELKIFTPDGGVSCAANGTMVVKAALRMEQDQQ
jgi:hypothetical protein